MAKDYRKYRQSRLQKIEDKKNTRQAIFFVFLSIVAIILIIVFGIPGLSKLAVFLGDLRSTNRPIEINKNNALIHTPTLFSSFEATNTAKIKVSGRGPADTKIKLLVNGKSLNTESDLSGNFEFSSVLLNEGENRISGVAIRDSQESDPSKILKVVLDQEPPEISIDSPEDGANFFDLDQEITIRGLTEPNSKIFINERFVIVSPQGVFSISYRLKDGENKFNIMAIDQASNENSKELTVNYTP